MRKFMRYFVLTSVLVVGLLGLQAASNPCSWEVGYVNRVNTDLWIAVNNGYGEPEVSQLRRKLAGALYSMDLCFTEHQLY